MNKACVLLVLTLCVATVAAQAPSPAAGRGRGERGSGQEAREYPRPDASEVRSQSGQWKVSDDWATMPPGTKWGITSAVTSDASGTIYVIRREETPILAFSRGKLVAQFGQGLYTWPHGIRIDREGYLWTVDGQDNVIYKMDLKQGNRILMTLGKRGVSGESPDTFNRPTDVAFAPNGDFFITDGYGNARVVKYARDGRFIKAWGSRGTGQGQFNTPHTVAIDSNNRVIVGDRNNSRVQVFDMDGNFIEIWTNLGAPYGMAIAKDDTLYVSDADAGKITVSKSGKVLDVIENLGRPHLICLDSSGALYMADVRAERARKIYK
jgi:DNA-binding beta-propeller fold protein YncE